MQDLEKCLSHHPKFNLMDLVTSKKTGLPMYDGTVVGISTANLIMATSRSEFLAWNEQFENWKEKPVYTVKFKNPQRAISFEEFKKNFPQEFDEDMIRAKYEIIPLTQYAMYVEDDLERI